MGVCLHDLGEDFDVPCCADPDFGGPIVVGRSVRRVPIVAAVVSGSRDITSFEYVRDALDDIYWKDNLVHFNFLVEGGYRGVDRLARQWRILRGIAGHTEDADWDRYDYGAAGPIRNQKMIDDWAPKYALIFPGGKGTADLKRRALKAQCITYELFGSDWRRVYS